MSALQSGHLSPRWCTVSAHDSQKRWCPQGPELYEDLYDWSNFAAVVGCPCCGFRRNCSILWRCLIGRLCRILVCAVVIVIGVSPTMVIQRCGVGAHVVTHGVQELVVMRASFIRLLLVFGRRIHSPLSRRVMSTWLSTVTRWRWPRKA